MGWWCLGIILITLVVIYKLTLIPFSSHLHNNRKIQKQIHIRRLALEILFLEILLEFELFIERIISDIKFMRGLL